MKWTLAIFGPIYWIYNFLFLILDCFTVTFHEEHVQLSVCLYLSVCLCQFHCPPAFLLAKQDAILTLPCLALIVDWIVELIWNLSMAYFPKALKTMIQVWTDFRRFCLSVCLSVCLPVCVFFLDNEKKLWISIKWTNNGPDRDKDEDRLKERSKERKKQETKDRERQTES